MWPGLMEWMERKQGGKGSNLNWLAFKHLLEYHKWLTDRIKNLLQRSGSLSLISCQNYYPSLQAPWSVRYVQPSWWKEDLKSGERHHSARLNHKEEKAGDNKWGNTPGSTWVTAIKLTLLRFSRNINLQVVRVILSLKITTYPNIQYILVIKSAICHQKGLSFPLIRFPPWTCQATSSMRQGPSVTS